MSPFTLLRNYRLSRTHVADIPEPLVKALWFHRYAQRCEDDAGPITFDPENQERFDAMMEEAERAADRRDAILASLRSTRELHRLADGHANNNAILHAQMGASNMEAAE